MAILLGGASSEFAQGLQGVDRRWGIFGIVVRVLGLGWGEIVVVSGNQDSLEGGLRNGG